MNLGFSKKSGTITEYVTNERISEIQNKVDLFKAKIDQKDSITYEKKVLVGLAIKKALLEIGKPTYDEVVHRLYFEHHCQLSDCYDHPEYIKSILEEIFGNAHKVIVESIKERLDEFNTQPQFQEFLIVMSR